MTKREKLATDERSSSFSQAVNEEERKFWVIWNLHKVGLVPNESGPIDETHKKDLCREY